MTRTLYHVLDYARRRRRSRLALLALGLWPLRCLFRGRGVGPRIKDFTYTLY